MEDILQLKMQDYYGIAEAKLGCKFLRPTLNFSLRGKSAGVAHLQKNIIRLNKVLCAENKDEFLSQVLPHEIAHLLVYQLYGVQKPHGDKWKSIMRNVFGLSPDIRHNLDVSSVCGRIFKYKCDCNIISLTIRRHNKVLAGKTKYLCRSCKKELREIKDE